MRTKPSAEQRMVKFVFRELYQNKSLVHLERDRGFHDGQRLVIGSLEIPDRDIEYLNSVDDELHVGWQNLNKGPMVVSMIVDTDRRLLVNAINFGLSRRVFAQQLDDAANQGLGTKCRDTICQYCLAKILSIEEYPWAPQVYCHYCDSLNTTIDVPDLNQIEKDFRICPECQLYSRPRQFTVAYFWFLFIHAEVSHRTVLCCNDCMRPQAWKMLFGNLFGVLGLPLAFTQLVRVHRDSIKRGPFQGLDEANRCLKKGRVDKALDRYWKIFERHPVSAGVLYNVAFGLISQGDHLHARETLELALQNCANYRPAQTLMATQITATDS